MKLKCMKLSVMVIALTFTGCDKNTQNIVDEYIASAQDYKIASIKEQLNLQDIASNIGETVYIKENGALTPYLIASEDYNGSILIIRRETLKEERIFDTGSADYENSDIDNFLSKEFLSLLDENISKYIIKSEIEIINNSKTKTITRKIFLLSADDVNNESDKALKYFKEKETEELLKYWTRTPRTQESHTVFQVESDKITSDIVHKSSGVRPALCLEKTSNIVQRYDIISKGNIYIIE